MINTTELDWKKTTDGLLPVIIQDNSTLQVLMLGYMNADALQKTQKEGKVTFYSRTKNRLWTKGETSGNYLYVCSIKTDCDNDSILIRVNPVGETCHTGSTSCFGETNNEGFIGYLQHYIQERHKTMPEKSYTTQLFNSGIAKIAQKVGEEAVETVIEAVKGDDKRMIYEASDLIYHLLVLLTAKNYSLHDIENELAGRHK